MTLVVRPGHRPFEAGFHVAKCLPKWSGPVARTKLGMPTHSSK